MTQTFFPALLPSTRSTPRLQRLAPRAGRLLLAAGLLLGAVQLAQAQSGGGLRSTMAGSSYVGLSGGTADYSRLGSGAGGFGRDSNASTYQLVVGTFFSNQNLGAELGYIHFGDIARAGGTTRAEGLNLSLVGRYPVGQHFNVLGRIGGTYGNTKVSAHPASGIAAGNEDSFDWAYGIGGELVINPMWSATLQYDEHYMKFAGSGNERVSTTTIGVRARF